MENPFLPPLPHATSTSRSPIEARLLTWNLRYDCKPDSIPISETIGSLPAHIPADDTVPFYSGFPESPWSSRRIAIAREVSFNKPSIIGVQEALSRQVHDLSKLFGEGYSWIGAGRDDGRDRGEFEAIYYRNDKMELQDWDTFWLSHTPFTPSWFPGASTMRSTTCARFRSLENGAIFTVMCTHWDDRNDQQRQLAASLLLYRGAHEAVHGPVFIFGDFNSPSTGPSCSGYEIMMGSRRAVTIPKAFEERFRGGEKGITFSDLAEEARPLERSGHHATFTGFKKHSQMDLQRIDFVMAAGKGWGVERYRVGENWWDREGMASDHRPVWVDVLLA